MSIESIGKKEMGYVLGPINGKYFQNVTVRVRGKILRAELTDQTPEDLKEGDVVEVGEGMYRDGSGRRLYTFAKIEPLLTMAIKNILPPDIGTVNKLLNDEVLVTVQPKPGVVPEVVLAQVPPHFKELLHCGTRVRLMVVVVPGDLPEISIFSVSPG